MSTLEKIRDTYLKFHKPGHGSVNDRELVFIQDCITRCRPGLFLEIGVASGMSSGFIANFMSENGGNVLHSIDINEKFYADQTKPTGFLINEIHEGDAPKVNLHLKKSAFDLMEILGNERIDMGFIDAHHGHPWPTIDTMLTMPHAKPGAWLLHHDLALYKIEEWKTGIGPKHLFDQFGPNEKVIIGHEQANIGYLILPQGEFRSFEKQLLSSLMLPWTAQIHTHFVDRFRAFLPEFWGAEALSTFDRALGLYNQK